MIVDLYSKRRKKELGDIPDVYQYENIPDHLKVQFMHILTDVFINGAAQRFNSGQKLIKVIVDILRKEYGVFKLAEKRIGTYSEYEELQSFFLSCQDHEKALDVIELSLRFMDRVVRVHRDEFPQVDVEEVITELNQRFREAGVGYQYESGDIVRVDSQFIHTEAVKPVLTLLAQKAYHSVNEEFLSAHEHYRHGKYEEAATDCLKAIESLLKTICTNRGWTYGKSDTVKKLIQIVLQNGLIPSFMDNQLNVLQTLLESGVPTVRNKLAGHGQGPTSRQMPDFIASYVLHLTATTLLLLGEADSELK